MVHLVKEQPRLARGPTTALNISAWALLALPWRPRAYTPYQIQENTSVLLYTYIHTCIEVCIQLNRMVQCTCTMDAILKQERALKNGQSGSGCGSFIRAEYIRVSSSSLGIPGGMSVSNEMQVV